MSVIRCVNLSEDARLFLDSRQFGLQIRQFGRAWRGKIGSEFDLVWITNPNVREKVPARDLDARQDRMLLMKRRYLEGTLITHGTFFGFVEWRP